MLYHLYNNLVIFSVKKFTPSKLGETWLKKMQNGESFLGEKHGKIAHWAKIRP